MYDNYSEDDIERMIKLEVKSLSEQLASYKRPTTVIITKDPLPRTTTMKVKRKEVKALIHA